MVSTPQQHELHSTDEPRLVSRIALLVVYLFLGSILSLTVVTSVFANDSLYTATANMLPTARNQALVPGTRERFNGIRSRFDIEKITFYQKA